jgi:hypothetical protein
MVSREEAIREHEEGGVPRIDVVRRRYVVSPDLLCIRLSFLTPIVIVSFAQVIIMHLLVVERGKPVGLLLSCAIVGQFSGIGEVWYGE